MRQNDGNWAMSTHTLSHLKLNLIPVCLGHCFHTFSIQLPRKETSELKIFCIQTLGNPLVMSSNPQAVYLIQLVEITLLCILFVITNKEYLIVWRLTAMDWSISRSRSSTLWFRASIDWRRRSVMFWNLNGKENKNKPIYPYTCTRNTISHFL